MKKKIDLLSLHWTFYEQIELVFELQRIQEFFVWDEFEWTTKECQVSRQVHIQ